MRFSLASALQAVVSLRLVPRGDKPGRVPACEVLINTAAVRDQIRDMTSTLNIPDLIKEGTTQYGMQSFDQSLMGWYTKGVISYESAVFFATSPAEFALRVQGVAGTSDNTWSAFDDDIPPLPNKLSPAQAARLAEIFDYLHRGLTTSVENIDANEEGTEIKLGFGEWQTIQAVQMLLARYSRNVAEPQEKA